MKPEYYEGETVMVMIQNNWTKGFITKINPDGSCHIHLMCDPNYFIELPREKIFSFNLAQFIEGQKGNN